VFTIDKIEGNNYILSNGQTYRANRLQKENNIDATPEEPVTDVGEWGRQESEKEKN